MIDCVQRHEVEPNMKLLIAIPARNEEESIECIIQRCLAARARITARSPVTSVEVTVVSDGSTDRTAELAACYAHQIKLIVFRESRGYGAAIKEAWEQSNAELLGFLDADGTCEPLFFADLCSALIDQDADIVLGCRLNEESKMPLVRRIGNALFAVLLSALSSTRVRDTASGMRVVRRDCLPQLYPLPDGLHFTPAMSAKALLSARLSISEVNMAYHERTGESKLRIVADGLRFLKTILLTAFMYRPSRPLSLFALVFLIPSILLMLRPIAHYLQHRSVLEWMIYRFVVCELLGTLSCLLFCAAYLSGRIANVTLEGEAVEESSLLRHFLGGRYVWYVSVFLLAAGTALVLPTFWELLQTGATYEHWSRFIVMAFCWSAAFILMTTKAVDHILGLVADRIVYLRFLRSEEARRMGRARHHAGTSI